MQLATGMKLWWVGTDSDRSQEETEVVTVGRKWAILSNHFRIDVDSLLADGDRRSCPGKCYPSKAAYEERRDLQALWRHFQRDVYATAVPDGITPVKIAALRAVLGIKA